MLPLVSVPPSFITTPYEILNSSLPLPGVPPSTTFAVKGRAADGISADHAVGEPCV